MSPEAAATAYGHMAGWRSSLMPLLAVGTHSPPACVRLCVQNKLRRPQDSHSLLGRPCRMPPQGP